MRIKMKFFPLAVLVPVILGAALYGRESYEDYMDKSRLKHDNDIQIRRDKPLSEINPEDREGLIDELRGAVREELDEGMSDEKNENEKRLYQSKFIEELRSIIKEEIEDAIRIKKSRYLRKHTIELGGFISYQAKGVESSEEDNNNILKVFPQFSFFLDNNIAVAVKGEAEFNLTTKTKAYSGGIGPQFVFGITKRDDICLYADMMAGISKNSEINDKIGFRYSNGFGVKFVLSSGVIFNAGVQLIFDNLGEKVEGFQNIIVPTIGITAWF